MNILFEILENIFHTLMLSMTDVSVWPLINVYRTNEKLMIKIDYTIWILNKSQASRLTYSRLLMTDSIKKPRDSHTSNTYADTWR